MSKHQLPLTPAEREQLLHAVQLRQRNWAAFEPYLDAIGQILGQADLLPPDQWSGVVVIGSTARCSVHDDPNELRTWTLVMPADEDEASEKISVLSPLGWELLGSRVGTLIEQHASEDEVGTFLVEQVSRPFDPAVAVPVAHPPT